MKSIEEFAFECSHINNWKSPQIPPTILDWKLLNKEVWYYHICGVIIIFNHQMGQFCGQLTWFLDISFPCYFLSTLCLSWCSQSYLWMFTFEISDYVEWIHILLCSRWAHLWSLSYLNCRTSLVAQMVESTCNAGKPGSIPGLGRSPGERNSNSFQHLAWEITCTKEPGGLQSMGLQRVRHDLVIKQWSSNLVPNSPIRTRGGKNDFPSTVNGRKKG